MDPNSSHIAVFLSLPPPILRTLLFASEEFLESLCGISQVFCEFVLLAAFKFLCSLFCLQRPTGGRAPAGGRLTHLLPGCQYLVSNGWCLCQRRYSLSLPELLAPTRMTFHTLTGPHTVVFFLNGRNFSRFTESGNDILSWASAFVFLSPEHGGPAMDFSSFWGAGCEKALG